MRDAITGFIQLEFMEVSTEVEDVCQTIKSATNGTPGPDGVQYRYLK